MKSLHNWIIKYAYSILPNWTSLGHRCSASLKAFYSLAGVAQWLECPPANQRVTGSIPGQGTCLGLGRSPVGGVWESTTHWCFSPSFPLSLKINKLNLFFKKSLLLPGAALTFHTGCTFLTSSEWMCCINKYFCPAHTSASFGLQWVHPLSFCFPAAVTYSKPRLATFWHYAKVELIPPTPAEIPTAIQSLKKIVNSAQTGSFKQLTVKVTIC